MRILWVIIMLVSLSFPSTGQVQENIPKSFSHFFTAGLLHHDQKTYLKLDVDSMRGDPLYQDRCSALFNAHSYLFCNFANAFTKQTELSHLLPDTTGIRKKFDAYLEEDTAFQRIFMRSIDREMVDPLPLDSALRIAAHFYYVHRDGDKATLHFCIGINKVLEMKHTTAHPYHAAFCYMALNTMENPFEGIQKVLDPYREELKNKPTDAYILECEQAVYEQMAQDPAVRKALLEEYERKAEYLNFELVE